MEGPGNVTVLINEGIWFQLRLQAAGDGPPERGFTTLSVVNAKNMLILVITHSG